MPVADMYVKDAGSASTQQLTYRQHGSHYALHAVLLGQKASDGTLANIAVNDDGSVQTSAAMKNSFWSSNSNINAATTLIVPSVDASGYLRVQGFVLATYSAPNYATAKMIVQLKHSPFDAFGAGAYEMTAIETENPNDASVEPDADIRALYPANCLRLKFDWVVLADYVELNIINSGPITATFLGAAALSNVLA